MLVAFPDVTAGAEGRRAPRRRRSCSNRRRRTASRRAGSSATARRSPGARTTRACSSAMKEQVAAPDTTRKTTDEAADVDVWNTADERVQSLQMIRADAGSQLHVPPGVRRLGEAVRQARRRDDEGAGRRARRQVGGRPRHARLHPRLKAAGRRLLPRQHVDRRADADREGPADGQPRLRHLAARHALPLLEGQQVPGLRPRRGHDARRCGGGGPLSFVDTEYDHPGTKPSYGIAGYTSDGKAVIVEPPVRPVAAAARRLGRRPTSPAALGARTKSRFRLIRTEPVDPDRAARGRAARHVRPRQAGHAVGVRPVDEEVGVLRTRRRAAEGARLRGRVVRHAGARR